MDRFGKVINQFSAWAPDSSNLPRRFKPLANLVYLLAWMNIGMAG